MGMFDYINFKMPCPECGDVLCGWQSKDAGCDMEQIEPDSVNNFYTPCDNCGAWLEFSRNQPEDVMKRPEPLTREQVEAMGFALNLTPGSKRPWARRRSIAKEGQ